MDTRSASATPAQGSRFDGLCRRGTKVLQWPIDARTHPVSYWIRTGSDRAAPEPARLQRLLQRLTGADSFALNAGDSLHYFGHNPYSLPDDTDKAIWKVWTGEVVKVVPAPERTGRPGASLADDGKEQGRPDFIARRDETDLYQGPDKMRQNLRANRYVNFYPTGSKS